MAVAEAKFFYKSKHVRGGKNRFGVGDLGGKTKTDGGKDGWSQFRRWPVADECGGGLGDSGGFMWKDKIAFWDEASVGDGKPIVRTFEVDFNCCPGGSGIDGEYFPNQVKRRK